MLEQQQLRRKDLKQLLEEMEAQRQNQAADYWLVQYQRLMDNIPESLQNAQQYLPSAPSTTEDGQVASAPPMDVFMETSCVICLDSTVMSLNFKRFRIQLFQILLISLLLKTSVRLSFSRADISAAAPNVASNYINARCVALLFLNDFNFISLSLVIRN